MLHREPDSGGRLTFRQISGLNEHGEYHHDISLQECRIIAEETIRYEEAWLRQMIGFFRLAADLFEKTGERHVRKVYDREMVRFRQGEPARVYVYHEGQFRPEMVSMKDYSGIIQ
jgi:hypothetical protein